MSENTGVLQARDVTVSIGETVLLDGVELNAAPGELVAVHGPSGAGKTTLLRTVAGLLPASRGEITLNDRSPDQVGWPAFRRSVVYVAQTPALLDASVADNLTRAFSYASAEGPFPLEKATQWLDDLQVGADRMEQNARSLSVGQQQRVALVRALLLRPGFVLLDEPTSALDKDSANHVERILKRLAATEGLGGFVVTHEKVQAERLCARAVDISRWVPTEEAP